MVDFTTPEKESLIDELSKLYFNRNFGSTSKADLDTLMFSAYIEHCLNSGKPYDDYSLSKELGITQTRVRSLKERKQLKYPRKDFVWEKAFATAVENAKYDKYDHYIKVIIQDINVMNEVRHFIEQRGWYDECSLNKKLLRIPLACFVEICSENDAIETAFSDEAKANIRKLKYEDSAVKAFLQNFTKEGLKSFLMSASTEIISEILPMLKFTGLAQIAFDALLKAIEKI
jgi:hypothetical protein